MFFLTVLVSNIWLWEINKFSSQKTKKKKKNQFVVWKGTTDILHDKCDNEVVELKVMTEKEKPNNQIMFPINVFTSCNSNYTNIKCMISFNFYWLLISETN